MATVQLTWSPMRAANSMTLGGRALNISIYIFNGHMKNKGQLTPKTTKKDAGILGSEASNYTADRYHAVQETTSKPRNTKDSFLIHVE